MTDCAWILDGVAQFVRSPIWTVPVSNFVDDKCIFFDSDAEMKLEYTPIHNEFQELVDGLLTTYIEELGVPMEDALNAIKASNDPTHKRLVEYLTYLDDFVSFKKLMEKRNVELEVEALRELEKQDAVASKENAPSSASPASEEDRDEELDAALRASQLEAELIMKEAEMEDLELQKALALSIASEHERQQKEAAAKAAGERTQAESDAEKQRASLEAANMEARKKNLEEAHAKVREVEAKRATTPPPTPPPQANVEPVKPVVDAAPAVVAEPVSTAPKQAEAGPNAPAVVRISATHAPTSKLPSLAPIGRHGAFGGSKPLPSIHKSFKELQEEHATTTPAPSAPAPISPASPKQEVSMEQFKARQEEIRRQRDMLLAMKKQQRNEELAQAGGTTANKETTSPSANGADAESKKLTIEIARRFRDDIVQESRK